MTGRGIVWLGGDPALHSMLEPLFAAGLSPATRIHHTPRRTVHRIVLDRESPAAVATLAVKIHAAGAGAHPLREWLKRGVGRSAARREWLALRFLDKAAVRVPAPRAWGRLASGEEIVVADFVESRSLAEAFDEAPEAERAGIMETLARAIEALHAAGLRHGDLHLGNLGLADGELVFFDLQGARALRGAGDRLEDLACLWLSLARRGWSPTWRNRLRERLGLGREFDAAFRRFLRDHLRGRTRRVLRPGRRWAETRVGTLRGLSDQAFDRSTLGKLLLALDEAQDGDDRRGGRTRVVEAEAGDRLVVVKRVAAGTLRRAFGDRLRGTSAARAFRAGQRHALIGDHAALPLAFLEERRLGLPRQSWLILEKVGSEDLDRLTLETPEAAHQLARDLAAWLAEMHAWGLGHRDLKAGNLRVQRDGESNRFFLIDLEDLNGPRGLSDDARLTALSQLNASLADEQFDIEARLAALAVYRERLPFEAPHGQSAREIARRSHARAHRWRGEGCRAAQSGEHGEMGAGDSIRAE
ncbi:MAG: hypothetical protein CL908_21555 [Deltaproteobacteria bacterium]|nr:hypothetical protein [Deltaproteobacteria bacterium]